QKQMRKAGNWRLGLRRAALRRLVALGRDARLLQPPVVYPGYGPYGGPMDSYSLGLQYGMGGPGGGGGRGFRDFDGEMDSLVVLTDGADLGDFAGLDAPPKEEPAERSEPAPQGAKTSEGGEFAGDELAEGRLEKDEVSFEDRDFREVGSASGE